MVMNPAARFELASRLRSGSVGIGELFSFLSGLYFRGKLAYATTFGMSPGGSPAAFVITSNRGLVPVDAPINVREFRASATQPIDAENSAYVRPFLRDSRRLAKGLGPEGQVVFLGSISTNKYIEVLLKAFGPQLVFPTEFVGRGDMSRGGLLLRCVRANRELEYQPVAGAIRHGKRPPKLGPA
jgi:hypothetical protein